MPTSDPIADMLARVRNAHMSLHKSVRMPLSKMKRAIADIMQQEGYIQSYEEDERDIVLHLKYVSGKPAIRDMQRVSRPSCRSYVGVREIPRVQSGLGINILSTSKGVLDGQRAQDANVGGELLCQIW